MSGIRLSRMRSSSRYGPPVGRATLKACAPAGIQGKTQSSRDPCRPTPEAPQRRRDHGGGAVVSDYGFELAGCEYRGCIDNGNRLQRGMDALDESLGESDPALAGLLSAATAGRVPPKGARPFGLGRPRMFELNPRAIYAPRTRPSTCMPLVGSPETTGKAAKAFVATFSGHRGPRVPWPMRGCTSWGTGA